MNDQAAPFEGLPVHGTSWDPARLDFPADADFQTGIGEWVSRGELEDPADRLMGGRPVPRIWLLLHEPGEGRLAAVTALSLARELMGRDQAVLLLDCDDERALLSGWADRHEQEGWIDLVRYGASLLTCGVRLPFPGRQGLLLGPGSYRPVDAQPDEIEQLLGRLRRQADDILLCCPIDASGRAWAEQADLRLLCWDRSRGESEERLHDLVKGMKEADTPLTGLVGFGPETAPGEPIASEAEPLEDEVTADPGPGPTTAAAAETPTDQKRPDPEPEPDLPEDAEPQAPSDSTPEETVERVLREEETLDNGEDLAAIAGNGDPDLYARKRGTSRVFWWIALGALILIVGSVWYYREFVMVTPLDGQPTVARRDEQTGRMAPTRNEAEAEPSADESMTGTDAAGEAGSAAGSADPTPQHPAAAGPGDTPPRQETEAPQEEAEPVADPVAEPVADEPAAAEFHMDPYLVPVGADGWAVHVYSFPDSQSTAEELAILHGRGFRTAVRTVQIKDRGRWQRIYLGSFSSREEAQEALAPLLRKLGADWGRPTEF